MTSVTTAEPLKCRQRDALEPPNQSRAATPTLTNPCRVGTGQLCKYRVADGVQIDNSGAASNLRRADCEYGLLASNDPDLLDKAGGIQPGFGTYLA